jgi:hypothetical protein
VQQRCRNIDHDTTLEWGPTRHGRLWPRLLGRSCFISISHPRITTKRTDDQSLLLGHGGRALGRQSPRRPVSRQGRVGQEQAGGRAPRAGSRPADDRSSPQAQRESEELEDQERLGSRAVTCHRATATALLGREPWAGECLKGLQEGSHRARPAALHAGADTDTCGRGRHSHLARPCVAGGDRWLHRLGGFG